MGIIYLYFCCLRQGRLCPFFCIVEIFFFQFCTLDRHIGRNKFRVTPVTDILAVIYTGIFCFCHQFYGLCTFDIHIKCQVLGGMCHDAGTVSWCLFIIDINFERNGSFCILSVIKTQADISTECFISFSFYIINGF